MLQEGDVIELKIGMQVYADIPEHFVYANRKGSFTLTHNVVTLNSEFDYLCGKYIVYKTVLDGGGGSGSDSYPSGHHVFCINAEDHQVRVDFYQSGFFTAMIRDIAPVGKATLKWTTDARPA